MDAIQKNLLAQVAQLEGTPAGAYNIRANGSSAGRQSTQHIEITTKPDREGIDIRIKPGTRDETVYIPVVLSQSGLQETVYNDFFIGADADVLIVAGCGIHNDGDEGAEHSGLHRFFVGKNARVRYVERHYGEGDGAGQRIMNPRTEVELDEGAYLEMETTQIRGVDSTLRVTRAKVGADASLVIREKLMTHGRQVATTEFSVELAGENSRAHVVSRSVARDDSRQEFISRITGNAKCYGHSECDAILMDRAVVSAIPEVTANHLESSLIHEAAIGKIAGEQIVKLMTLGLTEQEAEEQIVNGFLK